jgi:membrane protease YdiL (CAAX protease family)
MKALFDLKRDRFGLKTILHALMGIAVLIVGSRAAVLSLEFLYDIVGLHALALRIVIRTVWNIAVVFALMYLYTAKGFKKPPAEFRIRKPQNMILWAFVALALPAAVSCFFVFLMPGTFTPSDIGEAEMLRHVLTAVFSSGLSAGILEESIFRGYIMRLFEIRWNKNVAIFVPSLLFASLHIFNMEKFNAVDVLLLLFAGTAVGAMFSLIAYQSGSVWASATVHTIWNLTGGGDIVGIGVEPSSSVFPYILESDSTLLTGGAFGIESSLPAVIGYGIVILAALLLSRKQA